MKNIDNDYIDYGMMGYLIMLKMVEIYTAIFAVIDEFREESIGGVDNG